MRMHYDIYYSRAEDVEQTQKVGIEIQPPLEPIALQGLLQALTKRPQQRGVPSRSQVYPALLAEVTRNDAGGTAFWLTPNPEYKPTYPSGHTSQIMAGVVKLLLDPCRLHEIECIESGVAPAPPTPTFTAEGVH